MLKSQADQKNVLVAKLNLDILQFINDDIFKNAKGSSEPDNLYLIISAATIRFCFRSKSKSLISCITLDKKAFAEYRYDHSFYNYEPEVEPSFICAVNLADFAFFVGSDKKQVASLIVQQNIMFNKFFVDEFLFEKQSCLKLKTLDQYDLQQEFIMRREPLYQAQISTGLKAIKVISKFMNRFSKYNQICFQFKSKDEMFEISFPDKSINPRFSLKLMAWSGLLEDKALFHSQEWRYVFGYASKAKSSSLLIQFCRESAIVNMQFDSISVETEIFKISQ